MHEGSVHGPEGLDAALDGLFPDADSDDRARMAARTAACRRLCVVSGGPGTGKTTVAAAIVALLIELRLAAPERIALAAPTGKAAARLQEAVRGRHRELVSRIPALEGYEAHATTVHRWLHTRARNRRPIDALVLDESSMVDLTLMARVLAALPGDARLVLLGDASQLASVQPGAVFADVCRAGLGAGTIRAGDETATPAGVGSGADTAGAEGEGGSATDGVVNGAVGWAEAESGGGEGATDGTGTRGGGAVRTGAGRAGPPESSPLSSCVVELVRNWRFDEAGGIGRLAAAVVRGDGGGAVAALRDPADTATELRSLTDAGHFERLATTFADERFAPALRAMQSRSAIREPFVDAGPLSAFRVLCAHRVGAFGAERLNRLVERRLGALGLVPEDDAFYPGRPILVTRNDPRTGLSNGDTGVVVRDADDRFQVWFPELGDASGQPRLVAPARLPPHESFFAVTVHRAQGSEYDEVAVVPGAAESRVATRELLYTAVTRARRRVVVYGSEESVVAAVGRTTERFSGLREALHPARRPPRLDETAGTREVPAGDEGRRIRGLANSPGWKCRPGGTRRARPADESGASPKISPIHGCGRGSDCFRYVERGPGARRTVKYALRALTRVRLAKPVISTPSASRIGEIFGLVHHVHHRYSGRVAYGDRGGLEAGRSEGRLRVVAEAVSLLGNAEQTGVEIAVAVLVVEGGQGVPSGGEVVDHESQRSGARGLTASRRHLVSGGKRFLRLPPVDGEKDAAVVGPNAANLDGEIRGRSLKERQRRRGRRQRESWKSWQPLRGERCGPQWAAADGPVPGILDSDIDCRQGCNRVQIREVHDFFVDGMHMRFAIRQWRHVVRTGRRAGPQFSRVLEPEPPNRGRIAGASGARVRRGTSSRSRGSPSRALAPPEPVRARRAATPRVPRRGGASGLPRPAAGPRTAD